MFMEIPSLLIEILNVVYTTISFHSTPIISMNDVFVELTNRIDIL